MLDNLAIVGNGIIGTLCAIEIKKKYPKIKIQIIGDKNRPFSASVGAGAMANVYAEIENGPFKDANEARFLNIGLKARHKWLKIFDQLKITKKVITAKDTIVFLKKNASSFENYNLAPSTSQFQWTLSCYLTDEFDRWSKKSSKFEVWNNCYV